MRKPRSPRRHHRTKRSHFDKVGKGRFRFLRFFVLFALGALLLLTGIVPVSLRFLLGATRDGISAAAWVVPVAVSVLLLTVGWHLASHAFDEITYPLSELTVAAETVSRGDFSVRVSETGTGDLLRLMTTFNAMVADLERMDAQRRNLTADVAHELRNPLHLIQGNLEGILDGVYQPTEVHIQTILAEIKLLSRLVDDLRTLSAAESGQLALHLEYLPTADLLVDAVTTFTPQAESKNITLTADVEKARSLHLRMDVMRMNQVLGNLLANALRFTPPGGAITLGADERDAGVVITVADTGAGIPEDQLPHVFDRLWRGDESRARVDGVGGGLGLAIVKQLVDLHGGTVSVASEVGRGTEFTLTFPKP